MALVPQSFAEMWQKEHDRQLKMYGDALAQRMGAPPGGRAMSDAELTSKWNLRDPNVTPEMVAQMQASGATPDDITRAIYPEREKTYTIGVVGPEAQRSEAERIAALAAKQAPQTAALPPGVTPPTFLSGSLGPTAAAPAP